MKCAAVGVLLCSSFLSLCLWAGQKPSQLLVITNVNVVETRNGTIHPNLTVVVRDGVVQAVAKIAVLETSSHIKVINGNGKFLLPAPWDSQVAVDPLQALDAVKFKPNLSAIVPGRAANLVLVERYPASDIREYLNVEGLVLRGIYYSRSDLDKIAANAPAGGAAKDVAENRTASAP